MDEKYKDAFLLCDVEGMTLENAAKVLKSNLKTVATRLRRARKFLYDILKKYGSSILTLDQYLRGSKIDSNMEIDKYYLREDQIFLEPGDPKIEEYILTIINEIINEIRLGADCISGGCMP